MENNKLEKTALDNKNVNILTRWNVTFDKISKSFNSGETIIIKDFFGINKTGVVHDIYPKDKTVGITNIPESSDEKIRCYLYKFGSDNLSKDYHVDLDFGFITPSHFMYDQINKKIQIANKSN